MVIEFKEDVATRFQVCAKRYGMTDDALLTMLLDTVEPGPATLADLARSAREANLASDEVVDTAARSREILNAEFANWVDRRIRQQ